MVNDVSAGTFDELMFATVASLEVPYVLMHMKGVPQTMHQQPIYDDLAGDILDFLTRKLAELNKAGIHDIIIDPGFGFGKTIAHNFELLRKLSLFKILHCPLLVGLSRKSMVYKTLETTADRALNGTSALHMSALMNGANILRVHDVKEAVEVVTLFNNYTGLL
jgi:dihydropteroate synthase